MLRVVDVDTDRDFHLISNYCTQGPIPLLADSFCHAYCCYTSGLGDHNVAGCFALVAVVQNELGNLCRFPTASETLDDDGTFSLDQLEDPFPLAIDCQRLAYSMIKTVVFVDCRLCLECIAFQDHLPTESGPVFQHAHASTLKSALFKRLGQVLTLQKRQNTLIQNHVTKKTQHLHQ